jgi:hypothetical protein
MARLLAGCAGGQWVATPPCAVLHFVARRRLPAVKRTAPPSGRVSLQDQNRATCCIAHPFGGYAAHTWPRPVLIPAPFRRSHTPKANPLRGIAGQRRHQLALRVCWLESTSLFAALDCTPPGRGKSQAIEHNRALPKVGQSLRSASLGGLPLRALRVRVMVGYVLRPSPDKCHVGSLRSAWLAWRFAWGGVVRFRAGGRGRWPALPVVSLW